MLQKLEDISFKLNPLIRASNKKAQDQIIKMIISSLSNEEIEILIQVANTSLKKGHDNLSGLFLIIFNNKVYKSSFL